MNDVLHAHDGIGAAVFDAGGNRLTKDRTPKFVEQAHAHGTFHVWLRNAEGDLLFEDEFSNTVVNIGKNLMLNTLMSGSSYTVVGPFVMLISSVSFTAISSSDTMASHSGWTESGNANAPAYTPPRPTASWAAASGGSIALSAPASYSFTSSGTVEGCAIVMSAGSVSTIDNTGGTLFSAGLFTGGAQAVASSNTMQVSYSLSI